MDRGTGGPTMWSDGQLIEVIHGSPAAVDDALRAIQQDGGTTPVDLDAFTGGEVGLSATDTARLRELVAEASDLARWRGTTRGLVRFLEVATGLEGFGVDEAPMDEAGRLRPFHVVVHGPAQAVEMRPLIERIVESEKPAHVTCDIVLGEPA